MAIAGFDLQELIVHIGVWITFLIIFAESGLLIGFFLPGDSLIFTAGLLSSQGHFNIWYFLLGGSIAAILGDNLGYAFGRKFGPRIFNRDDSWLFKKDHVEKARDFYEKHGPLTIVLARFTPVVRTFAPILAGVGKMNYRTFLTYNIIGGLLWVWGLGLLGFYAGRLIPDIDKYILPILAIIIVASILPGILAAIRRKSK
jgi:membrane-associated protein